MPLTPYSQAFEELYAKYNRRQYVHPDPLEVLFDYEDPADREIAGLVAASLAYGRVSQILRSVREALRRMKGEPVRFLRDTSDEKLRRRYAGFTHRFCRAEHISALLRGVKRLLAKYGSLEKCFLSKMHGKCETILPALGAFVNELTNASRGNCLHLLPDPARGSACKRLNLFLRWMVRRDEVDPGCWSGISARLLIVPLDTHMHRIGLALGATGRKAADLQTALELTAAFRKIRPSDPVRYDFVLTRLGMREEMGLHAFLRKLGRSIMAR